MDWATTEAWLKTTILGIIILGALGSIAAAFMLKFAGLILRKLAARLIPWLIVSNVRPFTSAALHCVRFANTGRWAQLVVYAVGVMVALNAWFVIVALCVVAT